MSKAITKEYLIRQLKNFDDQVLESKYIQIGAADANVIEEVQLNGTALTVTNKAVNVEAVTGITVNSDAVTVTDGIAAIELPTAVQYKVAQQASAETGYLATYTLQSSSDGGTNWADVSGAAKINIPKDFLVKSVSLETVTVDDDPVTGYVVGDKYIDFVVNTVAGDEQATHLYLLVSDLIDVYTAGNGIDITSGAVSVVAKTAGGIAVDATGVSVALKTAGGLAVDANGVYIDFEDTDLDFSNWESLSV